MKKVIAILSFVITVLTLSACNGFNVNKQDEFAEIFKELKIIYHEKDNQHAVKNNIFLPLDTKEKNNAIISWVSSHPQIVQTNGIVTRTAVDVEVYLTLLVTIDDKTQEQTTIITVLGLTDDDVTVTYNVNGGSELLPIVLSKGSKLTRPTDPVKEGFDFIEWQLNGIKFDFDTIINEDIQLEAIWMEERIPGSTDLIPNRNLTFQDEFDGNSLDRNKWDFQNGTGREYGLWFWGNEEKQYYQEDNLEISNGTLKIHAKQEEKFDPAVNTTVSY